MRNMRLSRWSEASTSATARIRSRPHDCVRSTHSNDDEDALQLGRVSHCEREVGLMFQQFAAGMGWRTEQRMRLSEASTSMSSAALRSLGPTELLEVAKAVNSDIPTYALSGETSAPKLVNMVNTPYPN